MSSLTSDANPSADRAGARQARLVQSMARVRRRGAAIDAEKLLQVGGSVLLPTGLIVILLGWYGASHTSYGFEQTPYLISGGMLGAAMTVAGGFLYFGYWLTRLVHEGRRQRTELAALLTSIDSRMATLEGRLAAPREESRAGDLVATATGTLVHRPGCALVQGKAGLRRVDAAGTDLQGCKVCQPFSDGV